MKVISARALKNRMSDYFHEVEATGEELSVTQNGQLVLKIISYRRYSEEAEARSKHQDKNR